MRNTMAASLTETAGAAVQPPPGLASSPVRPHLRPLSVNGAPILGSISLGGAGHLLRRAASDDEGLSGSHSSRGKNRDGAGGAQFLSLHHPAASSPWGAGFDSVFQASDAEVRQGHEPQHRLRSHTFDPVLKDGGGVENDDDSIVMGVHGRDSGPSDRLDGLFRRRPNAAYSPVVGTPTRGGGGRSADWSPRHAHTADSPTKEGDNIWIPAIRPSLSCPTSVFESPLFPSSRSPSSHSLADLGSGKSGGSQGLGSGGSRGQTIALGGGGAPTRLLSELYPLKKIISASQEISPCNASENRQKRPGDADGDSLSSTEDPLLDADADGLKLGAGAGLENVDVSVIECDDEPSFQQIPNPNLEGDISGSSNELPTQNAMENGNGSDNMNAEIRNLSNAFELLGRGMEPLAGTVPGAPPRALDAKALSETGSDGTGDKPSPTSVLGLDGAAAASSSGVSTLRLENGLTVASISMPRFHLHDSLRGNLCQGLVDRVSFYSVVRDINKEASDAAATDPKGGVYNDGTVHGKGPPPPPSSSQPPPVAPLPPPLSASKQPVVAEDGKVHLHPDPREERRSVLVVSCLPDTGREGNNPNEGPSSSSHLLPPAAAVGPAALGAALLDEEWWLMSAIASRAPDEVAANQASTLLPTFYEAMGEKDASNNNNNNGGGGATTAADANAAGQGSRTQLWKPGRSWWEAKSGKNPWVEPVVHNNRWRYLWPLIHYHKFIAKCIKKLKRNGIDVKTSTSSVSLFLRQEVCNVSDHLAFMSKYDSEEWTSALSHFDGWTDHDPTVEETLRTLVASQHVMGVAETADLQSSLLRSQIDDKILKAMQAAREEAGRDAYDYKDAPAQRPVRGKADANRDRPPSQQKDQSFGRPPKWDNEDQLRSAGDSKKKTIDDASWSSSGYHHPGQYPPHSVYKQPSLGSAPSSLGYGDTDSLGSNYYPPPPHPPHPQYHGYPGQYPPPHHPPHPGYYHHPGHPMHYHGQYGHHDQYYNGGYYSADHSHSVDGSYHDGSFHHSFDNSMHSHHDPHYLPPSMMQTPNRYNGSGAHYPPASPYWEHLHISQLPGIAASPSIHVTPSKPPRGDGRNNRSYRKRPQPQRGQYPGNGGAAIDGKAKSLLMFPKQTNSPASRFVMSPQDKSNNPYYAKGSHPAGATPGKDGTAAPPSTSALNHSAGPEESFVLPTIEDYSAESPAANGAAAAHTSLHSNTSVDLMPPSVKKMYTRPPRREKLTEVSESP